MGHNQSKDLYAQNHLNESKCRKKVQMDNWTVLQTPQIDEREMGSFSVLKNKVTGQVAQVYTFHFDEKSSFQEYLAQFYNWRSKNKQNIIETKYICYQEEFSEIEDFCSSFHTVKLFVQSTSITLSQIKDIPPADSLYIVLSCLYGFEYLFQIFGDFPILQSMICLNDEGIVKVWIHPNLSQNKPLPKPIQKKNIQKSSLRRSRFTKQPHEIDSVAAKQSQSKFIMQLVSLIDKNTDYQGSQNTLINYIQQNFTKAIDFSSCRKALLNFAQSLQIDLPDNLLSILDILFQKSNRTSSSHQNLTANNEKALYGKNYQHNYLLGDQENNHSEQNSNNQYIQHNTIQDSSYSMPLSNCIRLQSVGQIRPIVRIPSQKISDLSEQLRMPKTVVRYENSTLKNSSQLKLSGHHETMQGGFHSQQLSEFYPDNPNYIPTQMTIPYSYQAQNGEIIPVYTNQRHEWRQNLYNSLVQQQYYRKQSTIREQNEQESFFNSYKNSKFQTSRELKRTSNRLASRNLNQTSGHRQNLSGKSDSNKIYDGDFGLNQKSSKAVDQDLQELIKMDFMQRKQPKKSIVFHSPNKIHQLDSQIAQDLEKMITSIKI